MKQLTKADFLSKLSRTISGWTVTSQGMLRDGHGRCPVVAVAEDIYLEQADGPTAYRRVAEAIGLPAAIAEEIVFAADHAEPRLPIRDGLLGACRTQERAAGSHSGNLGWWWDQPTSARAGAAETAVQERLPFEEVAWEEQVPQAA